MTLTNPAPKTRGAEMLAEIDKADAALVRLEQDHYTDEDVRRIVEELGSRAERFFKSAVFPGTSAGLDLAGLINRLKGHGGHPRDRRDKLHALRDFYNGAKHDADGQLKQRNALRIVRDFKVAMAELIATNPGLVNAPAKTAVSRVLWVSGYDSYTNGTTEVYISLPLPEEIFATHTDVFWLDYRSWDTLKADLIATGNFDYGHTHFTEAVYERFNEDDFIGAGIWDGDYRELVSIIARHEKRSLKDDVIASLRRDHMFTAVLSSLTLAAIDVAATAVDTIGRDAFVDAIVAEADKNYAIPDERPWVRATATAMADMILQLPHKHWTVLTGPYWNLSAPKEITAAIKSPDSKKFPLVIDDANRIVIG